MQKTDRNALLALPLVVAIGALVATAGAAATRLTVVRVTAICSVGAGVDEQAASAPSASAAVAVRISADECMVYRTPLEVVGEAAPVYWVGNQGFWCWCIVGACAASGRRSRLCIAVGHVLRTLVRRALTL